VTAFKRRDLPPVHNTDTFLNRVRDVLMTYMGRQGDRLDRGVTLRDLADANLIAIRPAYLSGADDVPIDGAGHAQSPNSSYLSHTESASLTAGASSATYTTGVVAAFKSTGAPIGIAGGVIVHLQSNNTAVHNCFVSVTLNMDGSDVILAGSGYYVASPSTTPTVETTIPIVFQTDSLQGTHQWKLKVAINALTSAGAATTFGTNTLTVTSRMLAQENRI
jgi:hypothetical protein